MDEWIDAARAWLEEETNPSHAEALRRVLERGDLDALRRGFAEPLTFGTAGLRGPVGFGPARMNEVVVARVSFGVGRVLLRRGLEGRPVVVGFDGRAESAVYAERAVRVLSGMGLAVDLVERPAATPIIVRAGRVRGAGAIIAVTPSHNPRGDAGFKVYDDCGIQIVAPWDREISGEMRSCPPVATLPVGEARSRIADEAHEEFGEVLRSFVRRGPGRATRASYTPLHGVGGEGARLVAEITESVLDFVPEQASSDGTFPTTPFPNPEEVGALDLLGRRMLRTGATLGLANDPDADRLAVVLRERDDEEPRRLSGDQLGLLLASFALERATIAAPLLVSSIVSSPGLRELARVRGARHEYTLTGFKWLCRPALDDPGFLFAYEEALGYCWAPNGRPYLLDKDGLGSMALLLDEIRNREDGESEGEFLRRRLDRLGAEVGVWFSAARSVRLDAETGPKEALARSMNRMRAFRAGLLGGVRVAQVLDFAESAALPGRYLDRQNLVLLELEGGGRLCVRPSGTEPKLKIYLHLRGEVASGEPASEVEDALADRAQDVLDAAVAALAG